MTTYPTWRYLTKMIRYAPGISLAHGLLWAVMNLSGLLPGLIAAAFFDTLTGDASIPGGTDALVALLALLALARAGLYLVAGWVEIAMRFTMSGFLRRNPPTLEPPPFADLQKELRRFFGPIIASLAAPESANGHWDPDAGAWRQDPGTGQH